MIKKYAFFIIFSLCCIQLSSQTTSVMVSDVKVSKTQFKSTGLLIKKKMEQALISYDYITLVDRDLIYLTERERRTQRNESFMDGKYVEQDKAIGAEWIFEIVFNEKQKELTLQIVAVETNEKFYSKSYKIGRFLLPDLSIERPNYFGRYIIEKVDEIMKSVDIGNQVDITIIEVSKTKGDKALEVVVYCKKGCGLKRTMALNVYKEEEMKPGQLYAKKELIGEIEIKHVESEEVYVATVSKGKKEILNYFNSDFSLICVNEN